MKVLTILSAYNEYDYSDPDFTYPAHFPIYDYAAYGGEYDDMWSNYTSPADNPVLDTSIGQQRIRLDWKKSGSGWSASAASWHLTIKPTKDGQFEWQVFEKDDAEAVDAGTAPSLQEAKEILEGIAKET